ncbi:MAG: Eco57I restriction-modification methylase domain-containing protein [Candidatus Hermodarchaeota archaeon]
MQFLNQKSLGIYYSPSQISRYVVQETLSFYLLGKLGKSTFNHSQPLFSFLKSYLVESPEDIILKLYFEILPFCSILDNSCGSGAFLVEALNVLLEIYLMCIDRFVSFQSPPEKVLMELARFKKNRELQIYYLKNQILVNNLYGVDIDVKAVELCKNRLWFSLTDSLPSTAGFIPPPDLDYNLLVGNSLLGLIDIPRSVQDSVIKLSQKREQLIAQQTFKVDRFQARGLKKSINSVTSEISNYLDTILFKRLEAKIIPFKDIDPLFINSPIHWTVHFTSILNQGGFDIIVGNPPWIQSKFMNKAEKSYYQTFFLSTKKQFDVFNVFVERSHSLLKQNGILGYILPTRFVMNPDYEIFRQYILDSYNINEIIDIGEDVFKNVNMPSLILIASKEVDPTNRANNKILFKKDDTGELNTFKQEYTIPQRRFMLEPRQLFTIYQTEEVSRLCQAIRKNSDPFRNFVINGRGVEIGKKHSIISPKCRDNRDVPFLIGEDIKRYQICNRHWIRLGVPNINYKTAQLYQGSKILVRKTGTGINATLDGENTYVIGVIYIFKAKSNAPKIEYLLALLNSKLMLWYYFMVFGEQHKKIFPHLRQQSVLDLPIKRISCERDNRYESILAQLAVYMLSFSENSFDNAKTLRRFIDTLMDNLVYELYLHPFTDSDLIGILMNSWDSRRPFSTPDFKQWIKKLQNNAFVYQEKDKIQSCPQVRLIEQKLKL